MAEFAVELLRGHDNSPDGFERLAFIELPDWLAHQFDGLTKKARGKFNLFQVVAETEKAYKVIYCRDTGCSFGFCRPTWFVNYVSKSIVKSIRTDAEQYLMEECKYYNEIYKKYKEVK